MQPLEPCPVASLLTRGGILYGVPAADKTAAIMAAIERMRLPGGVNRDRIIEEVLRRECLASTATGEGIAIPHPQNAAALQLPESLLTLAFLSQPVDFDAPDGQPVYAIFLLLSHNPGLHLRTLAHLGRALQNAGVRDALMRQLPAEEILTVFRRAVPALRPAAAAPTPSGAANIPL